MTPRLRPAAPLALLTVLLAGAPGCGADPSAGGSAHAVRELTEAPACFDPPACDATPPRGTPARFRKVSSALKSAFGKANHRVHDLLLAPSDPQWVIGTFAYDGLGTAHLEGEDVDVFVLRGCGSSWEQLGTARTTDRPAHAPVEGVADAPGHLYFEIPADQALGLGRHRIRLVVRGDLSGADGFIEVQPHATSLFVSDVDGTLTRSDLAEVGGILTNTLPEANPGAAAALVELARSGYRPVYLTARTESELGRTRAFLAARGFPPGLVRTTQGEGFVGLSGDAAASFKAAELAQLQGHGFVIALGLGNTDTDAQAYQRAGLPRNLAFATDAGAPFGAERFDAYASLPDRAALPDLCAEP